MIRRILPKFSSEFDDPRYFQILYLGSFLMFGMAYLAWELNVPVVVAYFLSAIGTQLIFCIIYGKSLSSVKSALITALGLSLLLHVTAVWVAVLAAVLAISSKFLIRRNNKHIFNPANFGIIMAIVLTGQAWISPGQWGSETILLFFIGSAGLMMILKVGRIDTAFTFLLGFGVLKFIYLIAYLGWGLDVWIHQMENGTLLLYTFFMITDPMTTPNHRKARIIWAMILALAVFIASIFFYIQTAAIWLLFAISPFTTILDKAFKDKKFEWKIKQTLNTEIS